MRWIDYYLDRITMYRLALYYLLALVGGAMLLGALGYLPYSPEAVAFGAGYLVAVCWITNKVFAYGFEVPANPESPLITGLILALIITPPASAQSFVFLSAAGGLAVSSKYILAIRGKHIFNPAVVAVALTAWGAGQSASWWIGNARMAPLVAAGGLLLIRKLRRGPMVAVFLAAALLTAIALDGLHGDHALTSARNILLQSSLLFLAFMMLTEPLTSPTVKSRQIWYAAVVGLLFSPRVHLLHIYSTPELALIAGNVFAYLVSPKERLLPVLRQKIAWGPSIRDFIFTTERPLNYKPGQYMEWTLPHRRVDSRGSRRYFTLASSPTEDNVRIGVKFYAEGSSYKRAMFAMDAGVPVAAGQLGGDFVLPRNRRRQLVFIAGGIGVTPFRSMLKYLSDTGDQRTVTLLYSEREAVDLAYHDVFKEARQRIGTKIVYFVTGQTASVPAGIRQGKITPQAIAEEVPDYRECLFYISGSHSLVEAMQDNLRALGIHHRNIKTDFFPGYA